MARALHLPAVLGVRGLLDAAAGASIVVVDGVDGQVVFDPGPDTLAAFRRRRAALARQRRRLVAVAALPAITDDGVAISLNANIDLPAEVDEARAGADGVGLLRTEIQFMNREDLPDEDAQYEMLRAVVEGWTAAPSPSARSTSAATSGRRPWPRISRKVPIRRSACAPSAIR